MTVFEKVAKNNGITEKEVESEINYAITIAMKNNDSTIQKNWQSLSVEGRVPTALELTIAIAQYILKNYMLIW